MVMLSTAFDVSQDQPARMFLVMAGFVSEAGCWEKFDAAWRKRLADDGLPYFQMHAFAHSIEPFHIGWRGNERRRRALIGDLLKIISAHAFHKFACIVQSAEFETLSVNSKEKMGSTPLAIAGTFMVGLVKRWQTRQKYQQLPEFIFEDGDTDKGTLIDAIKSATGQSPIFRQKKDCPEKGIIAFTPLQAADILAYETKKIADKVGHLLPADFKFRFPFQELNQMAEEPTIFNHESAVVFDELARIDQYFEQHPLRS